MKLTRKVHQLSSEEFAALLKKFVAAKTKRTAMKYQNQLINGFYGRVVPSREKLATRQLDAEVRLLTLFRMDLPAFAPGTKPAKRLEIIRQFHELELEREYEGKGFRTRKWYSDEFLLSKAPQRSQVFPTSSLTLRQSHLHRQ